MEGGAMRIATGLENQTAGNDEGSTPSPSSTYGTTS